MRRGHFKIFMFHARARVPATSANLGPGFDALGLALALYNEVIVRDCDAPPGLGLSEAHRAQAREAHQAGHRVVVLSDSARHSFASIPTGESNIAWRAARRLLQFIGRPDATFQMETINRIPLARGLGSSSAARVGALVAANEWARQKGWKVASPIELLGLATELEGHPDNAAAALLGGFASSVVLNPAPPSENEAFKTTDVAAVRLNATRFPDFLVWVPDGELATKKARAALPDSVSRADAVFNISRVALLVSALANGDLELLRPALDDRLHQPFRAPLIAGYDFIRQAALTGGALGVTISGAGSSVLIWLRPDEDTQGGMSTHAAREGIETTARAHRLGGELLALAVDHRGCVLVDSQDPYGDGPL